nr:hypothetical protein MFLOJ_58980 [Mycobacterium florentinum]
MTGDHAEISAHRCPSQTFEFQNQFTTVAKDRKSDTQKIDAGLIWPDMSPVNTDGLLAGPDVVPLQINRLDPEDSREIVTIAR